MKTYGTGLAAGAALALGWAPAAHAQSLHDKYWLQVSGYSASVDTDVRIAPILDEEAGSELDLETDLGFDDSEFLPAFFAGARLGSGFSIGAEYYSLGRDATATLARDIIVEDVTYPTTASITSEFNTDIYRLTVGWAFWRGENFEVGAAIGLHATDIEIALEGEGNAGGPTRSFQQRREEFLAPMPTIGLFASYEVMPRLTLGGRLDFLSLGIDDYDGRLINAQAQLAYRFMKNIGAGVMYRYVDYRVDVEKERYAGRFEYEFSGPAFFVEVGF